MKLALLLAALLAAGCQSLTLPNGAKLKTFGQRTVIGELSYSKDGVLRVKGYNNDQVQALEAAFNAGLQAGKVAAGVP